MYPKAITLALLALATSAHALERPDALRHNQIGYLTDDVKVAVYLGLHAFRIVDIYTRRP